MPDDLGGALGQAYKEGVWCNGKQIGLSSRRSGFDSRHPRPF